MSGLDSSSHSSSRGRRLVTPLTLNVAIFIVRWRVVTGRVKAYGLVSSMNAPPESVTRMAHVGILQERLPGEMIRFRQQSSIVTLVADDQ